MRMRRRLRLLIMLKGPRPDFQLERLDQSFRISSDFLAKACNFCLGYSGCS